MTTPGDSTKPSHVQIHNRLQRFPQTAAPFAIPKPTRVVIEEVEDTEEAKYPKPWPRQACQLFLKPLRLNPSQNSSDTRTS